MAYKKIDKSVLEHLKILCYEVVLGEMIDSHTMKIVQNTTRDYLDKNGFKINWVKCDYENNTADVIDSNRLLVHISEVDFPGSQAQIIHEIVL